MGHSHRSNQQTFNGIDIPFLPGTVLLAARGGRALAPRAKTMARAKRVTFIVVSDCLKNELSNKEWEGAKVGFGRDLLDYIYRGFSWHS
jgi:hypothetical protein